MLLLSGIFFGFTVGSYGLGIWLPQIVKEQQTSNLTVGFITAGCYVLACIGMVAWAAYVDRKGNRIRNLLWTCLASAAGLAHPTGEGLGFLFLFASDNALDFVH